MAKKKSVLEQAKSILDIGKEIEKERKRRENILKNIPKSSPWHKLWK